MSATTVVARADDGLPASAPKVSPYAFAPQLVMVSEPAGERAEAVRAIRTHVMAQHVDRGRRALAICAPSRGVGCTFTAANLAVALSQIGAKTVLVDADLHDPGVKHLIRANQPKPGLAACLARGDMHFSECIDFDVAPNLSVIFAGETAANPRELLAGESFQMLMDFCLRDFDVTIVDTPPANTSSDVRRISTVVGYSLIVAGRDRTYVNDVKVLTSQLRADHARVIGTVLDWA